MQKQLGRIGTVRVRSAGKRTHSSKRISITVPSSSPMPQENRVCVPSAVGTAVSEPPTTTERGIPIHVPAGSLVAQKNLVCVLDAAGTPVPQAPSTAWKPYRDYAMTEKLNVPTVAMVFVAWRAYRARMRQKREAIEMLALSCVLRPVDVELRYTTSLQRMGVCIGDPETQPAQDLTHSLYLHPLTTNIRVRWKQLLQWLHYELLVKYAQDLWKEIEIGKRRWQPFG